MTMENFPDPLEYSQLGLMSQFQAALAIEKGGEVEDWVKTYAEPFDRIIHDHPELIERFGAEPEEAIREAKQYLYH